MLTIIVPTDFSETANNAALYATGLAKEMNYEVLLFHVFTMPVIIPSEMSGTILVDSTQMENDRKIQLAQEAQKLSKKSGVNIRHALSVGFVEDEIVWAEKEHHASLTVMGLTSSGPVSEYFWGSIATDIMKRLHRPLIIVPQKVQFKKLEHVVFANDHTTDRDMVMNPVVKEILQKQRSVIFVLSVVKEHAIVGADKNTTEEGIENYFDNIFHSYHLIENESVVEGINDFIDLYKADMVIMMPHKHNLFERLFKGGNTKRFAFHGHVPVLSLPHVAYSDEL